MVTSIAAFRFSIVVIKNMAWKWGSNEYFTFYNFTPFMRQPIGPSYSFIFFINGDTLRSLITP